VFQKELYLDMLQQFFFPQLDENYQEGRIHFQQEGSPPHYRGEVREYLLTRFPEILHSMWQDIDYRWDVCRITTGSHIKP
jgi:hypothetical protein